jgi:hypothetical protein
MGIGDQMHDTIQVHDDETYDDFNVEEWDKEEDEDAPIEEQLRDLDKTWRFILSLADSVRRDWGDAAVDCGLANCERRYRKACHRLLEDFTS